VHEGDGSFRVIGATFGSSRKPSPFGTAPVPWRVVLREFAGDRG